MNNYLMLDRNCILTKAVPKKYMAIGYINYEDGDSLVGDSPLLFELTENGKEELIRHIQTDMLDILKNDGCLIPVIRILEIMEPNNEV